MKLKTSLLTVAVVAAVPASAEAKTVRGTVVESDAAAKTFVLTSEGGTATTVKYAAKRGTVPANGARVKASGPVVDGVLQAKSVKLDRKKAKNAKLRGTVVSVDAAARTFTVDVGGTTITITKADGELPQPGQVVVVHVKVERKDLDGGKVEHEGRGAFDVEGTLSAVDQTARTITVTPKDDDDDDEVTSPVTAKLPEGYDASKLAVGEKVEAKLRRLEDGSLLVVKIESGDDEDHGVGNDDRQEDDRSGKTEDRSGSGRGGDDRTDDLR